MTSNGSSPTLRSVCLRVHLGRHNHHWTIMLRTQRGGDTWDRRLHSGPLPLEHGVDDMVEVITLLELALDAARDLQRSQRPQADAGPPGGLQGGPPSMRVVRDPDRP